MSTSTFHFPDVNVWLALAHERHPHFEVATAWMERVPDRDTVYFCRVTQLSLLRLLTTPSAMGVDVMTQAAAWKVHDLFLQDNRVGFLEEPPRIGVAFRRRTSGRQISPKQWADGYIEAFAEASGLRLVTFDRSVARAVAGATFLRLR